MSYAVLLILMLVCSAFLSCAETALIAVNKIRLHHLVNSGSRRAKIAYDLVTHLDRLISTILVSNNLANIAFSSIVTALCVAAWGDEVGIVLATVIATAVILIFGEITPKLFAVRHAEFATLSLARSISVLVWVMRPMVGIFGGISNAILRAIGAPPGSRTPLVTEEEIRLMIELGRESGAVLEEERRLLHRIFEFGDTVVRTVMVPREAMVAVDVQASQDQLLELLVEEGHSRIPVFRGDLDHVLGVLYARDILYLWRENQLIVIPDLVQPVLFVAPSDRVHRVLQEFQRRHVQIAMVREGQRVVGLVTLEDLVEEIIGEIGDDPQAGPVGQTGG